MKDFTTKTIREIALEMPQTTRIFEEFNIDFCCGGRKPFVEACENAGVDPQTLALKLEAVLDGASESADYPEKMKPSDLIDYILEKHHVFTKNEIVRLTFLMEKVARKHGTQHAKLFDMQTTFRLLCDDLTVHLRKEEMALFPFIKTLEASIAANLSVAEPHFGTVKNPVRVMTEEHDTAGELLVKLREISGDYLLPDDACPSFKSLYFGLKDLEKDLHRHIHLENNVLFPQAVELEQKAFAKEIESEEKNFVCSQFAGN